MKFHNRQSEAEVSGLQASAFGFEMNAKMYDMLISKMYTNKPAAVIRELSANAWDAHVEAGNSDKPFELHLPTWLDKTFSIRDYGTGIPHDRFENIYTNVGRSTKEGTDELIGGFGLGSKAPFTMTDTFVVENWNGGTKTTWICFKSAGVPQVSKVSEEPSDEPSGLKVSFTFNTDEVREFTRQVTQQLKFFPVKPIVTGGEGTIHFTPLPDGWETKDYFFISEGASWERESYVVMGNVCYKLPTGQLSSDYRTIFHQGITLKVPIGAVDIPPSREHLEMTPRTVDFINNMLERVTQDYEKDVKARLDATKTRLEVRMVMHNVNKELLSRAFKLNMLYHGDNYADMCSSNVYFIAGYNVHELRNVKGTTRYAQGHLRIKDCVDDKAILFINDLWSGHKAHIEAEYQKIATVYPSKTPYFIHLENVPKKERDALLAKAIAEVTHEYGSAPVLLSSVIGAVPVKAKGTALVKAEPNQIYKLNGPLQLDVSPLRSCVDVTDIPTDGYFVELSGHALVSNDKEMTTYKITMGLAKGLGKLLGKPVYFVRTKSIPKVPQLIRLDSKVMAQLKPKMTQEATRLHKLLLARGHVHNIKQEHTDVLRRSRNRKVKVYMRYANYIRKSTEGIDQNFVDLCATLFPDWQKATYTPPAKLKPLATLYDDVNDLFNCITSTYSEERRKTRLETLRLISNL